MQDTADTDETPRKRWLVEIHPGFREHTGPFEDVGAPQVTVEHGCLVFRDDEGEILFIRAAGTWATVSPSEE